MDVKLTYIGTMLPSTDIWSTSDSIWISKIVGHNYPHSSLHFTITNPAGREFLPDLFAVFLDWIKNFVKGSVQRRKDVTSWCDKSCG